jgi:hypothetical protein
MNECGLHLTRGVLWVTAGIALNSHPHIPERVPPRTFGLLGLLNP